MGKDGEGVSTMRVNSVFHFHLCIIGVLLLAQIVLHVALIIVNYEDFHDLRKAFDLNGEHSIPNLLSAFAMAICGISAALVAFRAMEEDQKMLGRGWAACSAIMLFLAIDEGAGLHDVLSGRVANAISGGSTLGILYSAWVVPYAFAVLAAGGLLSRFALNLPAITRNRLAIAAVLYVCSAIGMELPEGLVYEQALASGVAQANIDNMTGMIVMHTIEEVGEMLAVALVFRALLLHLAVHTRLPGIIVTSNAMRAPSSPVAQVGVPASV